MFTDFDFIFPSNRSSVTNLNIISANFILSLLEESFQKGFILISSHAKVVFLSFEFGRVSDKSKNLIFLVVFLLVRPIVNPTQKQT